MKKKIAKVMPAGFGHLMLEFEDETVRSMPRRQLQLSVSLPVDRRSKRL
jgi:hypothetical protein